MSRVDLKSFDCQEVAERLLGPGRRMGRIVRYAAPWRDDGKKASLAVYTDGFKDFGGDGRDGDTVAFVQAVLGVDFKAAVQWLTGLDETAVIATRKTEQRKASVLPPVEWRQAMAVFVEEAHARLMANPEFYRYDSTEGRYVKDRALDYLKRRGISANAAARHRLGFNDGWRPVGFRDDDGDVKAAPGIVIPWQWPDLVAVRVRTFTPELDKYMSVRGSKPSAGAFIAHADHKNAVFTEGEFDAIAVTEHTGMAAITRGSASGFGHMPHELVELVRNRFAAVYAMLDNDSAGEAALQALQAQIDVIPVPMPDGAKDFTEAVQAGQVEAVRVFIRRHEIKPRLWFTSPALADNWRGALLGFSNGAVAVLAELIQRGMYEGLIEPDSVGVQEILSIQARLKFNIPKASLYRAYAAADGLLHRNGRLLPRPAVEAAMLEWIEPRLREQFFKAASPQPTQAMFITAGVMVNEFAAEWHEAAAEPYMTEEERAAVAQIRKQLETWRNHLEKNKDRFTHLPDWTIQKVSDYRAAVAHAIVAKTPGIVLSNAEWSRLIGCAPSYVNKVLKRAGVKATRQYEELPSVGCNLKAVNAACRRAGGKPFVIVTGEDADGTKRTETYSQDRITELAAQGFSSIGLIVQTANKHSIEREGPPEMPQEDVSVSKVEGMYLEAEAQTFETGFTPEELAADVEERAEDERAHGSKRVYGPVHAAEYALFSFRLQCERRGLRTDGSLYQLAARVFEHGEGD